MEQEAVHLSDESESADRGHNIAQNQNEGAEGMETPVAVERKNGWGTKLVHNMTTNRWLYITGGILIAALACLVLVILAIQEAESNLFPGPTLGTSTLRPVPIITTTSSTTPQTTTTSPQGDCSGSCLVSSTCQSRAGPALPCKCRWSFTEMPRCVPVQG